MSEQTTRTRSARAKQQNVELPSGDQDAPPGTREHLGDEELPYAGGKWTPEGEPAPKSDE